MCVCGGGGGGHKVKSCTLSWVGGGGEQGGGGTKSFGPTIFPFIVAPLPAIIMTDPLNLETLSLK